MMVCHLTGTDYWLVGLGSLLSGADQKWSIKMRVTEIFMHQYQSPPANNQKSKFARSLHILVLSQVAPEHAHCGIMAGRVELVQPPLPFSPSWVGGWWVALPCDCCRRSPRWCSPAAQGGSTTARSTRRDRESSRTTSRSCGSESAPT